MQLAQLFAPHRLASRDLGAMGERRAAWHYRLRGYRVLARNARLASCEADLVVRRGHTIAIVEVKTRQTHSGGEGYEKVDRAKRERMVKMGDQLAARYPDAQLRYDIVSLFWTGWRFRLTWYRDAFRPVADAQQPWKWRV